MRDAIVVGGGISGLTTAWHLSRRGYDVVLLEAGERVGGAIVTHAEQGWLFELGPNTVLENNPLIAPLVAGCGLAAEKIVARREAKRRYLFRRGRLRPLPTGPLSFLTTRLFSPAAKLRVAREPWVRPRRVEDADDEESVAEFVRRRLGQELLDYAVGPFVSGVYAGDPERLSARWAVAKIHALEQAHGSLIRGAFARRRGPTPSGAMISLRDGLETLPRRMAEGIGTVRTASPCRRVLPDGEAFRVETDGGTLRSRRVVLSVPADVLAAVLDDATDGASRAFAEMPYAPVAVVALGYRREDVGHPLDGFGFLAPRRESMRILGCLFPSSFFPGRAPVGHVALSAFAGGRTDPEIVAWEDGRLLERVTSELAEALDLRGEAVFVRLRRWPRAIPQYERGHGRYVALARQVEQRHPGLFVGGNVLGGVSVADCIRNAATLADRVRAVGD